MRKPSNTRIHQKAATARRRVHRTRAASPSPNPKRFVTLTFVAIISVAAGAALGATMYRLDLRTPKEAAAERRPVVPAVAKETAEAASTNQKTVIAVKTAAVKPLANPPVVTAAAALPAGSDRFGALAQQSPPVTTAPLVNHLRKTAKVDGERTGSIVPQPEPVDIAETEAQIIELEQKLTAEGAEHFKVPAESIQEKAPVEAIREKAPVDPGLRKRQIAEYVNLRAGPDNDAEVLAIVPAKAEIMAQDNCRHWCAAVYQGQKGFIYKTFFRQTAD